MTENREETASRDIAATRHGVVVGVDGSDHARAALHTGARLAASAGVPLTAVFAYPISHYAVQAASYGQPVVDEAGIRDEGENMLRQALAEAGADRADVRGVVKRGPAPQALAELSSNASTIVVGTRGRGGFTGMLLGSTSASLPSRSHCPVIIVPPDAEGTRDFSAGTALAVGVDESGHSRAAAEEAARWARALRCPVRLISALAPVSPDVEAWVSLEEQRRSAREQLTRTVEEHAAAVRAAFPDVTVETEVRDGAAAAVMVDETRSAPLTVVGTRGHGGFTGMLLGSTSLAIMHHAEGPLMIVPQS
ncbi:universal stress protein [Nesterenkonia sp. CL21]|uniref:universal stress protein n=1 Tax=Nesterenkonia sp. CL21 TaxID=3064894 RepID=UPI0028795F4F|nr:universal stress protein [Nesterenkonia sp. CL21]MDS2173147.1 universal stress protein [Nesterenkonia sp. CL21]